MKLFLILLIATITSAENGEHTWNKFLLVVIKQMKWRSVVYFTENHTDADTYLVSELHGSSVSTVRLSLAHGNLNTFLKSLNYLYVSNSEVRVIVKFQSRNVRSLLRKLSRFPLLWSPKCYWLIASEDGWFLTQGITDLLYREINIAFIVPDLNAKRYFIHSFESHKNMAEASFSVSEWGNKTRIFHNPEKSVGRHLAKKHFKFALERHFPFYLPEDEIKKPKPDGADIFLLNTLSQYLNFSYEIKRPPDRKWGSKHCGVWNGMIGMVDKQEVHGALGGMSIISSRAEDVQFSKAYAFDRITFVIRSPEEISRKWVIFRPFKWQVWLTLTLAVLFMAFFLTTVENAVEEIVRKYCKVSIERFVHLKLGKTVLYIYKSIVNQGCYNPVSNSGRVLITGWWLFVITIIAGYSGTLVSFMTHPGQEDPVDTIPELVSALKSGKYICGTIKDSADHDIFRIGHTEKFRVILEAIESNPSNFVKRDVEGLEKCRKENYAYIAGKLTTEADIEEKGVFIFARDSFQFFGYGIAFVKGFWFRDDFDRIILRLRSTGVIDYKIRRYIERKQRYTPEDERERVLTLLDLQGAFFVLIIGSLVGTIALFSEITVDKCTRLKMVIIRQY